MRGRSRRTAVVVAVITCALFAEARFRPVLRLAPSISDEAVPTALVDLATPSPPAVLANPTAMPATAAQSATEADDPFPTPAPAAVTLDEFWRRMVELAGARVFEEVPILPPQYRDDPLFGINNALVGEDATAPLLHGVGASIDRVELRWDEIEPAPGELNFERYDRIFGIAERWHLSVLVVIVGAPAWAVDRNERIGAGPPNGLDAPPFLPGGTPNPANPWASFLATVGRRYGHRVTAWEIWNEPNLPEFWRGTPKDDARLLQVADEVLGREAPNATVLVGGMVLDDGVFLRAVLHEICPRRECPNPPFDGVAWHIYGSPAEALTVAARTRELLAPYGVEPTIWITEANVPVDDPRVPNYLNVRPDEVSLDEQAAFVLQLYTHARVADVHTVSIYRAMEVDEGRGWGLVRQNFTGRPALVAYRTAAEWLSHARAERLSQPQPDVTHVTPRRPGEVVHVLWNDAAQPRSVRLAAGAKRGLLVRGDGTSSPLTAVGDVFEIALPAAAPARSPHTVPLGKPVLLVVRETQSEPTSGVPRPSDGAAASPLEYGE